MVFCPSCVLVWVSILLVLYFIFKKKFCNKCNKTPKILKRDWKKDTVYLYQFPRAKKLANLSPFCLKLEMLLRVNDIPYENCFITSVRSKYGLVPFIELNGEHFADSQLIAEKLKEHFKIKPLSDAREEAFARCLDRLADNHTLPIFVKYRAIDNIDDFVNILLNVVSIPPFLFPVLLPIAKFFFKRKAEKRVFTMLGPFSDEEFHLLLKKDLDAYRDALGEKKFLMGDEPTAADCTVFGQLATVVYMENPNEAQRLIKAEYPSLVAYLDRIVAKVFPAEFS